MLSPSKLNGGGSHHNNQHFDNPFATEDPFADNNSAAYIEPDLDLTGQSTTNNTQKQPASSFGPAAATAPPTGNIGSSSSSNTRIQQPPQQQQEALSTYSGEDTLDEPVSITIVCVLDRECVKYTYYAHFPI